MTEDVASRAFEPFFTTKGRHEGTGLGLSAAYRTVTQARGRLELRSAPGSGTTFTIYLPASEKRPPEATTADESSSALRGVETVLLVEDEASVRAGIARMLSRRGYEVLEAGDGREALAVAEQHEGAVDVLLTDVLMPKMSGRELAARLRTAHRGLKVVFMSGYTDEQLARHRLDGLGMAFVRKPFTERELLTCLRGGNDPGSPPP